MVAKKIGAKPLSCLQTRFVASEHVESFEHLLASGDLFLLASLARLFIKTSGASFRDDKVSIHLLLEKAIRLLKRLVRSNEDARQLTSPPFKIKMARIIP